MQAKVRIQNVAIGDCLSPEIESSASVFTCP
jgi:hypothetical protein